MKRWISMGCIFGIVIFHALQAQVLYLDRSYREINALSAEYYSHHAFYPIANHTFDSILENNTLKESFFPFFEALPFLKLENEWLSFSLKPSMHLSSGMNFKARDYAYNGGLGLHAILEYKDKLALDLDYRIHKFNLFSFENQYVREHRVLPYGGIPMENNIYHDLHIYLNWNPNKYLNGEVGFGRKHIGKGYRSLILSNTGYQTPYLLLQANVWKLQYSFMWLYLKDIGNSALTHWSDFPDKYVAMHHISWKVSPIFRFAFFEGVVWTGRNLKGKRGIEINYLNPIIFFRPMEFTIGSADNALLGVEGDITLGNHLLYGQFMLDEFKFKEVKAQKGWWANKQALQLGWRGFDLFRQKNLHGMVEFNAIRPFMYSHGFYQKNVDSLITACYGHYNHPLAHPLGANVLEGILQCNYSYDRWYFAFLNSYAYYGRDKDGQNLGANPFNDYYTREKEYGNLFGQGEQNRLLNQQFSVAYLLNKDLSLNVFTRVTNRMHKVEANLTSGLFVEIGITNIFNGNGLRWTDF